MHFKTSLSAKFSSSLLKMPTKQLQITKDRLVNTIHETAEFGKKTSWGPHPTQTGMCRLALTDEDKQVRDWFVEETKSLGCTVKIDEVGNIFAIYPGKNDGLPIGIGSHLDTQPTGGRYDGIYGVLSGLEVLRTFKDNNYTPNYPVAVIDWMNEEGARFPMSIMASSVWAENISKEEIYKMNAVIGKPVSVKSELERIGYLGDVPASYKANPLKAHFEIHIEQGPILEDENKKIGIVTGVQAYVWYKVKVSGRAQHTGTTPLNSRTDALLSFSKMMVRANELAYKYDGLCSVGILNLEPGSVNVIPEEVNFTLDIRHVYDEKLQQLLDEVKSEFQSIAKAGNGGSSLSVEFEHIYTSPAVHFDEQCISCVREASTELYGESQVREIVSGAGHDSCSTSTRIPTSMIFIPSKDGISHNPVEYSTPEQVAEGFEVLLSAVVKYDSLRVD